MQQTKDDRSLGDLFGDLARDMGTLVSQEVALARTEITDKATRVGKDVAMLAVGGLVAYAPASDHRSRHRPDGRPRRAPLGVGAHRRRNHRRDRIRPGPAGYLRAEAAGPDAQSNDCIT